MAQWMNMPSLSPHMKHGVLRKWCVQVGDSIAAEDILAEVEIDKASVDLIADRGGHVLGLLVAEGQQVAVGKPIAILGEHDEDVSDMLALGTT
jgi:pyruvate dehydrogenase E2 component (dihydrolipoamide acetyltransferase)